MPDTLSALSALMVAQAQESIFLKAARDKMKPGNVAKIANQSAEFYMEAHKQMGRDGLRGLWEKEWLGKCLALQKSLKFRSILYN